MFLYISPPSFLCFLLLSVSFTCLTAFSSSPLSDCIPLHTLHSLPPYLSSSVCPPMSSPCPFCLFSLHIPHSKFYFYLLFSFLSCAPRSLMPALFLTVSHQYLQRRQQENAQRQSRGEPPLPEEDITKMFKPPQPPPRMDTLLIAGTHTHKTQHLHTCSTRHLHHIDPLLLQTPSATSAPLTGAQVLFCNYLRHLEITII